MDLGTTQEQGLEEEANVVQIGKVQGGPQPPVKVGWTLSAQTSRI